ncbi:MAG TPA: glycine oxidase ThiO [Longimicrobiales bacterium]|nr:glycine oxidase ThiO [Longimicrobiales bacterium]
MRRGQADVVVVGGGIIGCAVARELALRGLSVMVLERDSPGRRATWAAAGMLSPLGETVDDGPFLALAEDSLRRYASYVHGLHEASGIDVEYRTNGKLHVALDGDDAAIRALAAHPAAPRFDVRVLDGDGARALEPSLPDRVTAGVLVGRDHRINNRLLAQALLASAMAAGVGFRTASPVATIAARHRSATGVRLASGEAIDAGHVVLAAGAWCSHIEGLPGAVPVRPVKGQMFAVDGRGRGPDRTEVGPPTRVVQSARCYIIPRDDGRILVGATVEDVGFRKGATPAGLTGLMTAAMELVPAIADLPVVETWAGFRPATPDYLPIIGADPDLKGLVYATGHYRNGILLAPVTAAAAADIVTQGQAGALAAAFGIERLRGG